jgi:hypothetical protein
MMTGFYFFTLYSSLNSDTFSTPICILKIRPGIPFSYQITGPGIGNKWLFDMYIYQKSCFRPERVAHHTVKCT